MENNIHIDSIESLVNYNKISNNIDEKTKLFLNDIRGKCSELIQKYNDRFNEDKEKYPFVFDASAIKIDSEAIYIPVYVAPKSFNCIVDEDICDLYVFYSFMDKRSWFMNHKNRHYPVDNLIEFVNELKTICV